MGDVDGNNAIDNTDVIHVINYNVGSSTLTGESLQAADADDNAKVDNTDAVTIINYNVGNDTTTIDGTKVVGDKTQFVPED